MTEKRLGIPIFIQGTTIFYVFTGLVVIWTVLLRSMSWKSCLLTLTLTAIPLYSIVVEGVPFNVDVILSFGSQPQNIINEYLDEDEAGRHTGKLVQKRPRKASSEIKTGMADSKSKKIVASDKVKPGFSTGRLDEAKLIRPLDASVFNVRKGPDYSRNKKKAPSGPGFYELVNYDFISITGSGVILDIGHRIDLSKYVPEGKEGWVHGAPRVLIHTLQIGEDDSSSAWFGNGKEKKEAKTYCLIMYFTLSSAGKEALENNTRPAQLLRRFANEKVDVNRFKSICKIMGREKLGLNFFLKKTLDQLDGKPYLPANKCSRSRGACYLEFNTFTQSFIYLARKAISNFKGIVPSLQIRYGVVVQGEDDNEMPEQIMASVEVGPGVDYTTMSLPVDWPLS